MEKKEDITNLVAEEVMLYLSHLDLVSKIKGEQKGVATEYSALSFGKPSVAKYEMTEDGIINADLDFSSVTWDYDYDNKVKEDINLDNEALNPMDTWKLMKGKNQIGFYRRLKTDMVDFDKLRNILSEKYGINFNLTYDEKIYSETKWNGSDGEEIDNRVVYHVIDSHMYMAGRAMNLEEESSFHL